MEKGVKAFKVTGIFPLNRFVLSDDDYTDITTMDVLHPKPIHPTNENNIPTNNFHLLEQEKRRPLLGCTLAKIQI